MPVRDAYRAIGAGYFPGRVSLPTDDRVPRTTVSAVCPPAPEPGREEAPRRAGGFFREIPAASYSPRGLPPKYHRR